MNIQQIALSSIVTDYLSPLFPGQAFDPQVHGGNVIVTVMDSKPTPVQKRLAVSLQFLEMYARSSIVSYFDDINVAAQLEGVPGSVEVMAPLGA
jgi:hypothetical protein